MNARSLAALPPEAKRLLAYVAEHRDRLERLARVRRWRVDDADDRGHNVYPPSPAVERLLNHFRAVEDHVDWYVTIRRATAEAVLGAKVADPIDGWRRAGGSRILAAADLELQGLVVLAVIERATPGAVSAADRKWLEAAARKVKLLPVP